MPTKHPAMHVTMPQALYDAIETAAGGKQKMSAYLRTLAAKELNITIDVKHGGKRQKEQSSS